MIFSTQVKFMILQWLFQFPFKCINYPTFTLLKSIFLVLDAQSLCFQAENMTSYFLSGVSFTQ